MSFRIKTNNFYCLTSQSGVLEQQYNAYSSDVGSNIYNNLIKSITIKQFLVEVEETLSDGTTIVYSTQGPFGTQTDSSGHVFHNHWGMLIMGSVGDSNIWSIIKPVIGRSVDKTIFNTNDTYTFLSDNYFTNINPQQTKGLIQKIDGKEGVLDISDHKFFSNLNDTGENKLHLNFYLFFYPYDTVNTNPPQEIQIIDINTEGLGISDFPLMAISKVYKTFNVSCEKKKRNIDLTLTVADRTTPSDPYASYNPYNNLIIYYISSNDAYNSNYYFNVRKTDTGIISPSQLELYKLSFSVAGSGSVIGLSYLTESVDYTVDSDNIKLKSLDAVTPPIDIIIIVDKTVTLTNNQHKQYFLLTKRLKGGSSYDEYITDFEIQLPTITPEVKKNDDTISNLTSLSINGVEPNTSTVDLKNISGGYISFTYFYGPNNGVKFTFHPSESVWKKLIPILYDVYVSIEDKTTAGLYNNIYQPDTINSEGLSISWEAKDMKITQGDWNLYYEMFYPSSDSYLKK